MLRAISVTCVLCFTAPLMGQETTPVAGKQVEKSLATSQSTTVPYLLYLPKEYNKDADKKWPMVLFLHGRGESHGPLQLVAKWGPPKFAKRGDSLPYILVSPQCPASGFWSDDTRQAGLLELLEHVTKTYRVDSDRVMLTGLSMGGYGSWRLGSENASKFSCVVPVCGGGKPEYAPGLVKIPVWAFHGDKDGAVPFKKSVEMIDDIRKAGGTKARLTSLEHVGHNCWSSTYAMPELYQWMLRQKASENQ